MKKIILLTAISVFPSLANAQVQTEELITPLPVPPSVYTADMDLDGRPDTVRYDNVAKSLLSLPAGRTVRGKYDGRLAEYEIHAN